MEPERFSQCPRVSRRGCAAPGGDRQPASPFNCAPAGSVAPMPAAPLAEGEYAVVEVVSRPQDTALRPAVHGSARLARGGRRLGQLRTWTARTPKKGIGLAQEVLTKCERRSRGAVRQDPRLRARLPRARLPARHDPAHRLHAGPAAGRTARHSWWTRGASESRRSSRSRTVEVTDGPIIENVCGRGRRHPEVPDAEVARGGRRPLHRHRQLRHHAAIPTSGWVNLGTYRVMVHDAQAALGYYISPGKHGRIHREKYFARGEPMPGGDGLRPRPAAVPRLAARRSRTACPSTTGSAACAASRVEVHRGPVTGLPIPAHAEIVLEGYR